MGLTTDPTDPGLGRGPDDSPVGQNNTYLVLEKAVRNEATFVRPVRTTYKHLVCGGVTSMSRGIAETYAVNPLFYSYTYCIRCSRHLSVGEFVWVDDGEVVGS